MSKILFTLKRLLPDKLMQLLLPAYHFTLSYLAAVFYRFPSEKIIVIGVTGTTGKTTSTYLIQKMLEGAGFKCGYTSTAMFSDGDREWLNDKKMTMPGRFQIQKILSQMVKNDCQYAVVETTSEGIRQFRHRFINYDTLIFTGLYPEHIESHGSFENYKAAKGELFRHLKKCKTKYCNADKLVVTQASGIKKLDLTRVKKRIIANIDDDNAGYFLDFWAEEKLGYSKNKLVYKDTPIWYYDEINSSQQGTSFKVGQNRFNLNILGEFNATNAMNAIGLGLAEGLGIDKIRVGLEKIDGVPGRLERINEGQDFTVIVDYAFEPNAVGKLYDTVDKIAHNNIIHLLGATGGGRDASRRPLIGKIAGERANVVIVTNEDPYDEDPEIIMDQVMLGAEKGGKKNQENLFKILDRREAIAKAISLAGSGDIVLITGKGSEQAICLANGVKQPWDDRMVVREEISRIKTYINSQNI
ncbi:MAG: UDP-N-acetylmuramyl-tripeptide synthetase [bacterium]